MSEKTTKKKDDGDRQHSLSLSLDLSNANQKNEKKTHPFRDEKEKSALLCASVCVHR